MRLIERENVGAGLHRSGWPVALDALSRQADGKGLLLDDCVIQSMRFIKPPLLHTIPWVGIFHSPVEIRDSPCNADQMDSVISKLGLPQMKESLPTMKGAIAMSTTLSTYLTSRVSCPVLTALHPTETQVPQWNYERFKHHRLLAQLGFHLRNLRAIFYVTPQPGWNYVRVQNTSRHHAIREQEQKNFYGRRRNKHVQTITRLDNDMYDAMLSQCVVLTRPYGVSACNVIVECIARGTPIVVDRTPETEEYLGADYCLYCGTHNWSDAEIVHANRQLLARRGAWLEPDYFAAKVTEFVQMVEQLA